MLSNPPCPAGAAKKSATAKLTTMTAWDTTILTIPVQPLAHPSRTPTTMPGVRIQSAQEPRSDAA